MPLFGNPSPDTIRLMEEMLSNLSQAVDMLRDKLDPKKNPGNDIHTQGEIKDNCLILLDPDEAIHDINADITLIERPGGTLRVATTLAKKIKQVTIDIEHDSFISNTGELCNLKETINTQYGIAHYGRQHNSMRDPVWRGQGGTFDDRRQNTVVVFEETGNEMEVGSVRYFYEKLRQIESCDMPRAADALVKTIPRKTLS